MRHLLSNSCKFKYALQDPLRVDTSVLPCLVHHCFKAYKKSVVRSLANFSNADDGMHRGAIHRR